VFLGFVVVAHNSQMKKSVTSNACTCHCYFIIGEKSSSEANKDGVQISQMNLDTIPLTAV